MADELHQVFTDHGLRCTRQRRAIYAALAESRSHPTADELHKLVIESDDEPMSLATVYNTLEALCSAGLAHKLASCGENGSTRYDIIGNDHLHLRCCKSGKIADAPDDLGKRFLDQFPDDLLKEVEQRLGFTITRVQIDLVGEFKKNPSVN